MHAHRFAVALVAAAMLAGCGAKPMPVSASSKLATAAAAFAKTDPSIFDDLSDLQINMAVKDENWDKDLKGKTRGAKWVHVYLTGDMTLGGTVAVVYDGGLTVAPSSASNVAKLAHLHATLTKLGASHARKDDVMVFANALGRVLEKAKKPAKPAKPGVVPAPAPPAAPDPAPPVVPAPAPADPAPAPPTDPAPVPAPAG